MRLDKMSDFEVEITNLTVDIGRNVLRIFAFVIDKLHRTFIAVGGSEVTGSYTKDSGISENFDGVFDSISTKDILGLIEISIQLMANALCRQSDRFWIKEKF